MVEDVIGDEFKALSLVARKNKTSESPARRVVDATSMYLKEIGFVPLLTASEEVLYSRKFQQGCERSRHMLSLIHI